MVKFLSGLVAAAFVFAVGSASVMAEGKAGKATVVCPVMKASIGSPDQASGKSVHKGQTYYFCCAGCKPAFDAEPLKYVCPVDGRVLAEKPAARSAYKGKTYSLCGKACKMAFNKNPKKYLAAR